MIISELEDTFSFVITVLRIVGILLITVYVAIGLGAGPIKHIRGYSDPREELVNGTLKHIYSFNLLLIKFIQNSSN